MGNYPVKVCLSRLKHHALIQTDFNFSIIYSCIVMKSLTKKSGEAYLENKFCPKVVLVVTSAFFNTLIKAKGIKGNKLHCKKMLSLSSADTLEQKSIRSSQSSSLCNT